MMLAGGNPRLNLARPDDDRQVCAGLRTDNVSAGGVYFRSTEAMALRVGQDVDLQLSGLSSYNSGPLFRILHGRATILRLDSPPEAETPTRQIGVAARFSERPRIGVYRFSA